MYFPEGKELLKLPRDWIANVANTIVGVPFEQWVKQITEARNSKVASKGNLNIEMDPELAAAFAAST